MVLPSSSTAFSMTLDTSHKFSKTDNGDNIIWLKGES